MRTILLFVLVGLFRIVLAVEPPSTIPVSIQHISGNVTYKVEQPEANIPDRFLLFDLEIKSEDEWRARVTPIGVTLENTSPKVLNVTHSFQNGFHKQVVKFDPQSFVLQASSRTKSPRIVPNSFEVYDNPFPYWNEWGFTALWLGFCSGRLDGIGMLPSSLYTMDRDSSLPATTNFSITKNVPGKRFGGPTSLSVPFSSVFPEVTSSAPFPFFEFLVDEQEMTSLGLAPRLIHCRFNLAVPNTRGAFQFSRVLLVEIHATNFALIDNFNFGDEELSTASVKDYRLRTKSGKPIVYISTNGIPDRTDAKLVKYADKYQKMENVLASNLPQGVVSRRKTILKWVLVLSVVSVSAVLLWFASRLRK